jgi:hypothetical protein
MQALCLFALAPTGFRHRELRAYVGQLLARDPAPYASGQMTYDLRRLHLHGLIARVPRGHRYRVTDHGARVAICTARLYARAIRPALSIPGPHPAHAGRAFQRLDLALTQFLQEVRLAA